MIESSRMRSSTTRKRQETTDPANRIVFEMIQSSANDNVMPATKWFTWLIAWTIVVGAVLAYAIF